MNIKLKGIFLMNKADKRIKNFFSASLISFGLALTTIIIALLFLKELMTLSFVFLIVGWVLNLIAINYTKISNNHKKSKNTN